MDFRETQKPGLIKFIGLVWPVVIVFLSEVFFYIIYYSEIGDFSWRVNFRWPKAEFFMAIFAIYYLNSSPFSRKNTLILSLLILSYIGLNLTDFGTQPTGAILKVSIYLAAITLYTLRTRSKESIRIWDKLKLTIVILCGLCSIAITAIAQYCFYYISNMENLDMLNSLFEILQIARRPLYIAFIGIHIYMLNKQIPSSSRSLSAAKIDEIGKR